MATMKLPTGEEYRKLLKKMVAAAGQEIIDRADDIVGNGNMLSDLSISVHFEQPMEQIPELEITRRYVCKNDIDVLFSFRMDGETNETD